MKNILILILSSLLLLGCAQESEEEESSGGSFDSGVPEIEPPVQNAAPSALTSSSLAALRQVENYRGTLATASSSVSDESSLGTWLTTNVFNTCDSCPSSLYFRYWPNVVDDKISEMERRFSQVPNCINQTATQFDLPNPLDSETITIYLSCNDTGEGSNPSGVSSATRYFGFNGSSVYLLFLTEYTNSSRRALIAEASTSGDDVKIWDIAESSDDTSDTVVRIFANPGNNSFSYFFASEKPEQSAQVTHFFARRSGDYVYLSAQYDSDADQATVVPTDIFASGSSTTACRSASSLTTDGGSNCSGFSSAPSGFDIGAVDRTAVAADAYNTDIATIFSTDFSNIPTVEGAAEE